MTTVLKYNNYFIPRPTFIFVTADKNNMAQVLQKYLARAPRHILTIDESRHLRFAHSGQIYSDNTAIRDVSITGMAFEIDATIAPDVGEMIKIEFSLPPGNEQIACYAKVVRRDQNSRFSPFCLIGVHFEKLTIAHRMALEKNLREALQLENQIIVVGKLRHLALLLLSSTIAIGIFYLLSHFSTLNTMVESISNLFR